MYFLSLAGALSAAFMLSIQRVRCTGLIHDLVEGAAMGRGGEEPSNYNMDMVLTLMYTAAVFFIRHICYCLVKYGIAVSGLDIGCSG